MFASQRRDKIIQWLQQHEQLVVKELAKELGVSEGTLRTDLRMLEEEGAIERTHGGAVLAKRKPTYRESGSPSRSDMNYEEKLAIGTLAATLVSKGQCILLDASSTVLEVAKALAGLDYITVVTNGLDAAMVLNQNPRINVILIGGVLRSGSRSIEGVLGKGILDSIHGDLFFTSAEGVSLEEGMTDFSLYEAELKKRMAANARMTIAVADHTKLGRRAIATSVAFGEIDTLITDAKADAAYLKRISGVRVLIAAVNGSK